MVSHGQPQKTTKLGTERKTIRTTDSGRTSNCLAKKGQSTFHPTISHLLNCSCASGSKKVNTNKYTKRFSDWLSSLLLHFSTLTSVDLRLLFYSYFWTLIIQHCTLSLYHTQAILLFSFVKLTH